MRGSYIQTTPAKPYDVTITGSSSDPSKATTTVVDQGYWARLSENLVYIEYNYQHTNNAGAAAGSGAYIFSVPAGITLATPDSGAATFGSAYIFSGSTAGVGTAYVSTSDSGQGIRLFITNPTAISTAGSSNYALNGSTVQISFYGIFRTV